MYTYTKLNMYHIIMNIQNLPETERLIYVYVHISGKIQIYSFSILKTYYISYMNFQHCVHFVLYIRKCKKVWDGVNNLSQKSNFFRET